VVLDAGHGGEDAGAEGLGGLLEKDVVLDIVLRLEELLQARSDLFVHLTRRGDDFIPLAERTKTANLFKADLFISIHNNASPAGRMQGLETYYLDNTNNEASRKLAERENRFWTDNSGTVQSDLQFMLSDLIQNMKKDDSIALAGFLHRSILQNVRSTYSGVKDLGVKKAPFYVLVGAHMPCVLLELLFIDNEGEGMLLANPEFRQELAKGIYIGINLFLSQ
jgi:N-acetylmuramoyl-L-alanine amidase